MDAPGRRPLLTDDAAVIPKSKFDFEFSTAFDRLQRSSYPHLKQNTARFELNYGLFLRIEMGVEIPLLTIFNVRRRRSLRGQPTREHNARPHCRFLASQCLEQFLPPLSAQQLLPQLQLEGGQMRKLFRENGLSIVLFGLFFFSFIVGQCVTGQLEYNQDQQEHQQPTVSFLQYLGTGHFLEATMENWESEFLQMFTFVVLTTFLYQKGSAESKKLDEEEAVDRDPRQSQHKEDAPWPVRHGGWVLWLYERSLSLAFLLLFLVSFFLHALGGAKAYSAEQLTHGESAVSTLAYLKTSRFWFEAFQNWQSEFLAIGSMVVLTIFLRQRGAPESKPVDSPHSQTGHE